MKYYNNGKPISQLEYDNLKYDKLIDEDTIYLVEQEYEYYNKDGELICALGKPIEEFIEESNNQDRYIHQLEYKNIKLSEENKKIEEEYDVLNNEGRAWFDLSQRYEKALEEILDIVNSVCEWEKCDCRRCESCTYKDIKDEIKDAFKEKPIGEF